MQLKQAAVYSICWKHAGFPRSQQAICKQCLLIWCHTLSACMPGPSASLLVSHKVECCLSLAGPQTRLMTSAACVRWMRAITACTARAAQLGLDSWSPSGKVQACMRTGLLALGSGQALPMLIGYAGALAQTHFSSLACSL